MAAGDRFTGKDVAITFGTITANFKSIEINVDISKFEALASDTNKVQRGDGVFDAGITITGWDSEAANSASFEDIIAMVLSRAAPTALSYTDKGAIPASKLPAAFWTMFPLSSWRVDSARGGSGGPADPNDWTAVLTPNNF